jgi:hypothetical protein
LIQLDISKAFDTIPHEAIDPALRRLGIPSTLRSSIINSYESLNTHIEHKGSRVEVQLQRGLKQGDPLSPFLFNAIMNPLLEQLEELRGFTINETQSISSLTFADDLILIADDMKKAQLLLTATEKYLCNMGMKITANKCTSVRVQTTRDSWYISTTDLHLATGDQIPSSNTMDTIEYLGGHFSPWTGLQHKGITTKLQEVLHCLKSAFLKPHQKLNLLTTYLIPHFLHSTIIATPSIFGIRDMDSLIRVHVKDILHLPLSTPNGLLYCGKRDGGLGVPKLEVLATSTALKHGIQLLNTVNQTLLAVLQATNYEKRLERIAKSVMLPWPELTTKQIDAHKRRKKAEELKIWSQLPSKGKSMRSFADDKYGNCWLYDPTLLKPCRFLTALRMHSGTTSDRVTIQKAIPQTTVKCRKCKNGTETLAHILGQYIYTKTDRIRRHNKIRDFISKKLATNPQYQVIEEASIETPSGTLKPDLVVILRERVHVIDVTVRHEDIGYLEEGHNSKIKKYTSLIPTLAKQLQQQPGRVLPIVIGTRGALPKSTVLSLEDLGITDRGSLITLTLLALRNLIEIYHAFIEYDVPSRKRPTLLVDQT